MYVDSTCPVCQAHFRRPYRARHQRHCSFACARAAIKGRRVERFWSYVRKTDSCWLWTGGLVHGYGHFQQTRAHRFAYELANGPIPKGLMVCHRCDVRNCVRNDGPNSHLFLGSAFDNMGDAAAKGRMPKGDNHSSRLHPERLRRGDEHPARLHPEFLARGEQSGRAKLTVVQVLAIRARYASGERSMSALAGDFGVSSGAIWFITRNLSWRHLLAHDVDSEA